MQYFPHSSHELSPLSSQGKGSRGDSGRLSGHTASPGVTDLFSAHLSEREQFESENWFEHSRTTPTISHLPFPHSANSWEPKECTRQNPRSNLEISGRAFALDLRVLGLFKQLGLKQKDNFLNRVCVVLSSEHSALPLTSYATLGEDGGIDVCLAGWENQQVVPAIISLESKPQVWRVELCFTCP